MGCNELLLSGLRVWVCVVMVWIVLYIGAVGFLLSALLFWFELDDVCA